MMMKMIWNIVVYHYMLFLNSLQNILDVNLFLLVVDLIMDLIDIFDIQVVHYMDKNDNNIPMIIKKEKVEIDMFQLVSIWMYSL
jgi:hypothetical protein